MSAAYRVTHPCSIVCYPYGVSFGAMFVSHQSDFDWGTSNSTSTKDIDLYNTSSGEVRYKNINNNVIIYT